MLSEKDVIPQKPVAKAPDHSIKRILLLMCKSPAITDAQERTLLVHSQLPPQSERCGRARIVFVVRAFRQIG
jgi:hypothetical protein